jgi:hypothetical protein
MPPVAPRAAVQRPVQKVMHKPYASALRADLDTGPQPMQISRDSRHCQGAPNEVADWGTSAGQGQAVYSHPKVAW